MAKFENGDIKGAVGPTVFRKLGKQTILQAKAARKVKQSAATKEASVSFGRASRYGSLIRRAFYSLNRGFHDSSMIGRLTGTVNRAIRINREPLSTDGDRIVINARRLVGFSFNEHSHLQDCLLIDPLITYAKNGLLTIKLPAFNCIDDIIRLEGTNYYFMRIEAYAFDFANEEIESLGEIEFKIPISRGKYYIEAKEWNIETNVAPEKLILVGMCLEFHRTENRFYLLNDKQHHPAGIIGAFTT